MSDSSRASLFAATLLGLALLLLLPCPAHAKKQPVDVPAGIEHRDFDALLKKYVDERGLVAYGRWKASAADLARLDRYLAQFDRPPTPVPAREKQSALINAYNGLVIRWMITNYPLDSIWEAKRSLTARRHRVGGQDRFAQPDRARHAAPVARLAGAFDARLRGALLSAAAAGGFHGGEAGSPDRRRLPRLAGPPGLESFRPGQAHRACVESVQVVQKGLRENRAREARARALRAGTAPRVCEERRLPHRASAVSVGFERSRRAVFARSDTSRRRTAGRMRSSTGALSKWPAATRPKAPRPLRRKSAASPTTPASRSKRPKAKSCGNDVRRATLRPGKRTHTPGPPLGGELTLS